jgi:hypothetical protein
VQSGLSVKEKQIDPQSLMNLAQKSLNNVIVDHHGSGPLPKNCIYYGVFERNAQKPAQIIIIEREAGIRSYNHLGTVLQVGYPKLLFCYRVVDEYVKGFHLVAAVDEIIKNDSDIYRFPYANVNISGVVCLGGFNYPPLKELAELTYYPEGFLTIEHSIHGDNTGKYPFEVLLKKMENRQFDNELLILDCNFKTLIKRVSGI